MNGTTRRASGGSMAAAVGSGSTARVLLTPAYVLHARDYRETSRIVELYARDHGRLSAFARGARGPKARLGPVLQPFARLLVSWSGRGEAVTLTHAELDAGDLPARAALPAASLMPAWYLSELLMKLTTRHDAHPALFDAYERALEELAAGPVERALRRFEKHLLEELGYGVDFGHEAEHGGAIDPGGRYRFVVGVGLVAAEAGALADSLAGAPLLAVAQERFDGVGALEAAGRVLRAAIDAALEGRTLSTRAVARAIARETRPRDAAGAGGEA